MARKAKAETEARCCGEPISVSMDRCRVEALVSVDERGQMVLPKDLRDRMGIRPGDKMAIVSWSKDGGIYCISLIKADAMAGIIRDTLGPMMTEMAPGKAR